MKDKLERQFERHLEQKIAKYIRYMNSACEDVWPHDDDDDS